jgi:hypothetical protein
MPRMAVCMPLETARLRLMVQSLPSRTAVEVNTLMPYRGVVDCIQRVAAEEGVGALYRGWELRAVTAVLTAALGYIAASTVIVIET